MIPYVSLQSVSVGWLTVSTFKVMMAAAVLTGITVVMLRARSTGLSASRVGILLGITTAFAFFTSRLFDLALYRPGELAQNPIAVLFVWRSMSSFGAILGTVVGAIAGVVTLGLGRCRLMQFLEVVGYALPFAWLPARAGCALVHDHPGIASDHWLAVDFPHGSRFDLGLLEFLYVIPIATVFWLVGRRPRRLGLYLPLFLVLYGPGRFVLDELRVWDIRYLGWTPAQYGAVAGMGLGVFLLVVRQLSIGSPTGNSPGHSAGSPL